MSTTTTTTATTTSKPTLAFFGATGGCANACLAHALKNGYHAVALARTPSKLTAKLLAQGIPQSTLDSQLRIVQGDATDTKAVESTIALPPSAPVGDDGRGVVDMIISGIGGAPVIRTKAFIIPVPDIDQPHIAEGFTKALLAALREINADTKVTKSNKPKPLVTVISSTGMTKGDVPNDVPLLLRPLYSALLAKPHRDKRLMEEMLEKENVARDLVRGTVIVKASLLMGDGTIDAGNNGANRGWKGIKVGTEKEPAVGYTISRADVGEWIFEEVVRKGGERWIGEKVTLTS